MQIKNIYNPMAALGLFSKRAPFANLFKFVSLIETLKIAIYCTNTMELAKQFSYETKIYTRRL